MGYQYTRVPAKRYAQDDGAQVPSTPGMRKSAVYMTMGIAQELGGYPWQ